MVYCQAADRWAKQMCLCLRACSILERVVTSRKVCVSNFAAGCGVAQRQHSYRLNSILKVPPVWPLHVPPTTPKIEVGRHLDTQASLAPVSPLRVVAVWKSS